MAKDEKEKFDKDAFIASMKAKHEGNADTVIAILGSDNANLREDKRKLKEQLENAPKAEKDGLILTAEEAKEYNANKEFFSELELDRKAIKETLEKVPELEKENGKMKANQTFAAVGASLGYKPKVLADLQAVKDFSYEDITFKTEKDDKGEDSQVPYIKTGDKDQPFSEFAKDVLADFLPSLKVDKQANENYSGGHTPDIPPSVEVPTIEADKKAKNSQAQATRSFF